MRDELSTPTETAPTVDDGSGPAEPVATRRGLFGVLAAAAALAGFGTKAAKADTRSTVLGAPLNGQYGLLTSTSVAEPILPTIGTTTHSIIGSQTSLGPVTLDSGVLGARAGTGRAGVLGLNTGAGFGVAGRASDGVAVSGESTTNVGVSGKSDSAAGVLGESNLSFAVRGISVDGTGVQGESTDGFGVRGLSRNAVAVRGESIENSGVFARTSRSGVPALLARTGGTINPIAARFVGNVRVEGNFAVTGAKAAAVEMPDGSLATMYCQESPEPFFEDFGRARLTDGAAVVTIDPAFASLVKADDLMVFLTPEGESEMLFVHAKNAEAFEVREARGGRSNHAFSWRLVARRKDITGERLARLDRFEDTDVADLESEDSRAMIAAAAVRSPVGSVG